MEKIVMTDEEKAEEEKKKEKEALIALLKAFLSDDDGEWEVYAGEDARRWEEEHAPREQPLVSAGLDGRKIKGIEIGVLSDEKPKS